MNDPVPFYDQATQLYHLFSLCNPTNSTIAPWSPGGAQGYCHAYSTNMATDWIELPLALNNSMGTGVVIPIGKGASSQLSNVTTAIYTSGAGLAVSSDPLLSTWTYISQVDTIFTSVDYDAPPSILVFVHL